MVNLGPVTRHIAPRRSTAAIFVVQYQLLVRRGDSLGPSEVQGSFRVRVIDAQDSVDPGPVAVGVQVGDLFDRFTGGGAVASPRPAQRHHADRSDRQWQAQDLAG